MAMIIPVILSGGSGTRLWPVSRPDCPKQLLPLVADETMLELTVRRVEGLPAAFVRRPIVVAGVAHAAMIESQLASAGVDDYLLLLEPVARNTAPAIALAAYEADDDDVLLVMPSDHVIADLPTFHDAIARALPLVDQGWLITFGVTPSAPETGYGYIKIGAPLGQQVYDVERFVEKPSADRAAEMLAAGGFAWNAGIFLFRADAYLAALERHQPEIVEAVAVSLAVAERNGRTISPQPQAFAGCPSKSVDYAIMEQEKRVACVPVSMGWSDVGSWDSLYALHEKDEGGNAVRGRALPLGANNCLIHTDGPRVTLVDVDDLIVVVSRGEIMVVRRGESQKIGKVADVVRMSA